MDVESIGVSGWSPVAVEVHLISIVIVNPCDS